MSTKPHRVPLDEALAAMPNLKADTIGAFRALELKPREMVLAPIVPQQGLVMAYSWRGVGKTHIGLGMDR